MAAGPKRLIGVSFVRRVVFWAATPGDDADARPGAARIVSLVPALTEMLFASARDRRSSPSAATTSFPPEVKSLPRVGALLDPDMERILALRPDLVVSYGSQTDCSTARAGEDSRVQLSARRAAGVFTTLKDLGAAVAGHRGERLPREIAGGSTAADARARTAADRARCSSSSAIRRRCAASTSAAASAFLHDMLGDRRRRQRVRRRRARVGAAVGRDDAGAAPRSSSKSARPGLLAPADVDRRSASGARSRLFRPFNTGAFDPDR